MTRARIFPLLLALLLAACGGGDPEPDDTRAGTQPVDCKNQPEVCR